MIGTPSTPPLSLALPATRTAFCLAVSLACVALLTVAAHAQEMKPRFLKVIPVAAAPTLDGALDDPCWQKTDPADPFVLHKTANPTDRRTLLHMCYDDTALYIGVDCLDETPEQLVTERMKPDDPGMWRDSTVEVFLKPNDLFPQLLMQPPTEQHVHIILNAAGVHYDQLGTGSSDAWTGNWTSAVARNDAGWSAELAIPFEMFMLPAPKTVTLWKAQVARNANTPGTGTTWSPTGATYREEAQFGALVFVPDADFTGSVEREAVMQLRLRPVMDEVEAAFRELDKLKAGSGTASAAAIAAQGLATQWAGFKKATAALDDAAFLDSWETRRAMAEALRDKAHALARDLVHAALVQQGRRLVLYPYPAITDAWILPSALPDLARLFSPVTVRACPGEFEPATFVMYCPTALNGVEIEVAPLVSDGNELPADTVDVRIVKCWYQEEPTSIGGGAPVLLPELLLKDPSLIKVNHLTRRNDIKHYGMWNHPGDADTLQPFTVPAEFAQQLWLTIHPPEDAAPGVYTAEIRVTSIEGVSASIPLSVEVLDFILEPSMLDHGLYNCNNKWGTQDEARVLSEMHNLADHGITHMFVRDNCEHFARILPLMRKAGLRTDRLFTFGMRLRRDKETGDLEPIDGFKERARAWIEAGKKAGAKDVYIYLIDEASGETLAKERPYAEAVHELGGKTTTACNSAFFELAGDFLDAPIVASAPMGRELVDAIHAKGTRIYNYANPQCGLELPETYRRNYGLLLWQAGYDGAMDFAWYWPFNNIWNDFDHDSYKDHNMVYPTSKGVIDTIQWEGWREGADDCRYMATLLKAIHDAGDTPAARAARNWVDSLDAAPNGQGLEDLDTLRDTIIQHIRACRR